MRLHNSRLDIFIPPENLEKNENLLSFTPKFSMYQPRKYQKNEPAFIFDFINRHPFATLVVQGERLLATHIPVLTQGTADKFILYAHIANHNEQKKFLKDGSEVLLIFQGAHAYISSSWYQEKNISTWNYSAVHINATITLQSPEELETSLENLIEHFEKDQENPLYYKDIPEQMLKEHLPLITGFWCEPVKMEAIAKLHQGYVKEDVVSVIRHLEDQNSSLEAGLAKDIRKEHQG